MTHGGARKGAGKPKGHKSAKTLEKEESRKFMQNYILGILEPILRAQASVARGVQYVYAITTTVDGKGNSHRESTQLTSPGDIQHALNVLNDIEDPDENEYYYITSEKPDLRAIDSMIDRVFGKASQHVELDNPKDNEELKKINDTLKEMFHNVKSRKPEQKN